MNNRHALSRLNGRDSFVMLQTADLFTSNVIQFASTDRSQAAALEAAHRENIEFCYSFASQPAQDRKPFIYQDGIAIIPIHGALINRFGGSWGFVTGYQAIRSQMNAALEDDDVQMIVFDVDSPGGEAAGCMELADEIRASRDAKPSLAVVDSLACSAGYALASAATQMVATPSSKIGSIGVYSTHVDISGALDQAGIKVTLIEAPQDGMKTAGSQYRPLDDAAKAEIQSHVNATYADFVETVVANRGLADTQVAETQGRVFRADEALALGLIDAVKTPSEAVSSFLAELADDFPSEEDDEMKNGQTGSEATSAAPAAAAPAAAAPAVAAPAAAAPTAADIQAAIREDRQRMAAIKALPEAAKLPKFADHLATSGATVEEATAALAAAVADLPAPAPAAAAPGAAPTVDATNHLETAMAGTKQPEVGAGSGGDAAAASASGSGEPSEADLGKSILADHAAATGRRYDAK